MTPKQAALLKFIAGYMESSDGKSPSFGEMAAALGLKSKSSIHKLVSALVHHGFIKRRHGLYRSIRIVRMPGVLTTADSLHEMVARLRREEGTEIALAALIDLAKDLVPLLDHEPVGVSTVLPDAVIGGGTP